MRILLWTTLALMLMAATANADSNDETTLEDCWEETDFCYELPVPAEATIIDIGPSDKQCNSAGSVCASAWVSQGPSSPANCEYTPGPGETCYYFSFGGSGVAYLPARGIQADFSETHGNAQDCGSQTGAFCADNGIYYRTHDTLICYSMSTSAHALLDPLGGGSVAEAYMAVGSC